MNLPILLCFLSYLSYVACQISCKDHKTCGKCIGHASDICIWCAQDNFTEARCQSVKLVKSNWCKKGPTYNPKPESKDLKANVTFDDKVQFLPLEMKIKARPGIFVNFSVSYKSADNFPLDVYFLMDYSYTMSNQSEALKKQVKEIFKGLTKKNNVQLGVGSFIEKPGLPYADTIEAKHYAYAFKNHLALTDDMDSFIRVTTKSEFGSNYDDAEAGLDALMQVMKCDPDVGWRNGSRRIIVLATDATYHSAGDGKMLGAIKPNDMKCHLKGNEYDPKDALIYDYPSVGQINKVATEGNFIIIFAALAKVKTEYEVLAKRILGAAYAELKENSNILKIITEAYEKSVREVKVHVREAPPSIRVKVDQDCKANPKVNCESFPNAPIVTIPISIKSIDCPNPGATVYPITIFPEGLNDKLKISFEVDCQCECEKNVPDVMSEQCTNMGKLQCGACKCIDNRGGDYCEFNCSDAQVKDSSKCMEPNSTKICNDHGSCTCGKCECINKRSGEFCQYHDGLCPHKNDKVCAGNGVCKDGKCECDSGWTGKGCDCPDHNTQCFGPFSTKVCSGRGTCVCGECVCDKIGDKETYLGVFCDSCEECANERCEELKYYGHCNLIMEQELCNKEFNITADIEVSLLNKTELNLESGTKCRTELKNGSFLLFKYETVSNTKLRLKIQNEVEQPPVANIWIPVGSAIFGILLVGILTAIIWKILIDMYDKREYERFCDEAKAQGYDVSENPLYEPPTQNFVNPGFSNNVPNN